MIVPSPQYDFQNESQFRAELDRQAAQTVRTDKAAPFILLQEGDITYRVSIVGGVLDVQPA